MPKGEMRHIDLDNPEYTSLLQRNKLTGRVISQDTRFGIFGAVSSLEEDSLEDEMGSGESLRADWQEIIEKVQLDPQRYLPIFERFLDGILRNKQPGKVGKDGQVKPAEAVLNNAQIRKIFKSQARQSANTMEELFLSMKEPGKYLAKIMISNPASLSMLSRELLKTMTDAHVEEATKEIETVKKQLETLVPEIESLLVAEAESGKIPLMPDRVEEIISTISFFVVDGINAKLEDTSGRYSRSRESIEVSSALVNDPIQLKSTITHELLHALSGRAVVKTSNLEHKKTGVKFRDQKIGLSFFKGDQKNDSVLKAMSTGDRFGWLNEAITESMTHSLLKTKTENYKQNIELYKALLSFLPEGTDRLFIKAYFEDFNPDEQKGGHTPVPAWHELVSVINTELGVGFLTRLDKYIQAESGLYATRQTKGIKKALQGFSEQGKDFVNVINEWAENESKKK